ncbi:hypothetical protein BCEN4_740007 [Burkholderia cenocepacia]|nr:hypothetical protein BCEN4_740007 [Burkholderia cenocepacia]
MTHTFRERIKAPFRGFFVVYRESVIG